LFREQREPTKAKLVAAAELSIDWYEKIAPRLPDLSPTDLVFDYMTRTGRVDGKRLAAEFPIFMAQYADEWAHFEQAA